MARPLQVVVSFRVPGGSWGDSLSSHAHLLYDDA